MNTAIKLVLKEKTLFDVYYLDGSVKRYDILSLADKFPQLEALKDRKLFLKGHLIGWSGVVWNDELDIDCETVYEEGEDVTSQYNDIQNVVFGYLVKRKRIENGFTQIELAQKANIDQSDLSKLEKGALNPSIKMMKRIADAMNTKLLISL